MKFVKVLEFFKSMKKRKKEIQANCEHKWGKMCGTPIHSYFKCVKCNKVSGSYLDTSVGKFCPLEEILVDEQ